MEAVQGMESHMEIHHAVEKILLRIADNRPLLHHHSNWEKFTKIYIYVYICV